jgi:hypothetical protein
MRFDLQAAVDEVRGAEWDWPLRLIARHHCAIDVNAPVLFRVSRRFEYCWRLAVETNRVDLRAASKDSQLAKTHRLRERKQHDFAIHDFFEAVHACTPKIVHFKGRF